MAVAQTTVRRVGAAARHLEADICVVGSGAAGLSAALESARLGRRTILVDASPQLGGQAVTSALGTFCGFFSNGPTPVQVTRGVADEFFRTLAASGALTFMDGRRNTRIGLYDVLAYQRWAEEAVRASGVVPLLGGVLRAVRRDTRRIASLEVATRYGDVNVEATGFVDASGDAVLAWLAGFECRETGGVHGTMMMAIDGVDDAALAALDRRELFRRVAERGASYGLVRRDGFVFAAPGPGEALVNLTHFETPLDALAMSRVTLDGRAQADAVVRFLRAEFPGAFGRARVRAYGLPGVRQTRSIVGAYQLTAADVRGARAFPDAVARCAWPIELHDRLDGVTWEEFGDDHMHAVPLGSLLPAETDNLVAAGRCIDADPVALSSVRVMGPCVAMGAAAAHALDLAGAGSVHQLDVAALRARIAANLA